MVLKWNMGSKGWLYCLHEPVLEKMLASTSLPTQSFKKRTSWPRILTLWIISTSVLKFIYFSKSTCQSSRTCQLLVSTALATGAKEYFLAMALGGGARSGANKQLWRTPRLAHLVCPGANLDRHSTCAFEAREFAESTCSGRFKALQIWHPSSGSVELLA